MATKEQIAAALMHMTPATAGPDFYKQVMGDGIAAPSMMAFNAPQGQMDASGMAQGAPQAPAAGGMTPTPPTIDPTQVAPVPHPYPIAPDSYVIQKGDTLTSIARKFGMSVKALQMANGIKNANMIVAGRKLRLA